MIFLHFFFLNALAQPAFLYKEKTDGVNLQCFMTMERPFNQKQICLRLPPKPMLPSNVQFRNMLSEQLLRTCPLTDEITKATNVSHMQMRSTLLTVCVLTMWYMCMTQTWRNLFPKHILTIKQWGSFNVCSFGLKNKRKQRNKTHTHKRTTKLSPFNNVYPACPVHFKSISIHYLCTEGLTESQKAGLSKMGLSMDYCSKGRIKPHSLYSSEPAKREWHNHTSAISSVIRFYLTSDAASQPRVSWCWWRNRPLLPSL